MFQDDRMISILSAIVLMVAIGTVIQRADFVSGYFGEEPRISLNADVVDARPNRLLRIDVLKNDEGISDADRNRLTVVGEPTCGRVFIQGQALQYLPDSSCVGEQVIQYAVQGHDDVVGLVLASMTHASGTPLPDKTQAVQTAATGSTQSTPSQAPNSAVVSAPEASEATVSASDAGPAVSPSEDIVATRTQPETPGVIETLIAGSAQPAQAAVQAEPTAATGSTQEAATKEAGSDELPEPRLARAATAMLDTPSIAPDRSEVSSLQSARVDRSAAAPEVSASDAPGPGEVEAPQITLATPTIEVRPPDPQRNVSDDDRFDLATIAGSDQVPNRATSPGSAGEADQEPDTGFLVAIVSRKEPNTKAPQSLKARPDREGLTEKVPSPDASLSQTSGTQLALAEPLQIVTAPDAALTVALPSSPVDTAQPSLGSSAVLASTPPPPKPVLASRQDETQPPQPGTSGSLAPPADRNAPQSPTAPASEELAALPRHDAPCVIPPAMTIDVRRAARSIVSIDAPCHADTIAELEYSGIRLAVPLDGKGRGSQMVLGFEPNAPALLMFVNGEKIDFDLPFKEIGRVSRVALIWDMPVSLELNAIEFGAAPGSEFHIRPDNARSFEDVRRSGGGFLDSYRSFAGIGQNAQIYTFYHRRGGQQGVVELMVDFASRNRDLLDGTCGDGKYAAPNFLVLRSEDARLERPIIRKLSALGCSSVAEEKGDKRLISGAVADLLIVQR